MSLIFFAQDTPYIKNKTISGTISNSTQNQVYIFHRDSSFAIIVDEDTIYTRGETGQIYNLKSALDKFYAEHEIDRQKDILWWAQGLGKDQQSTEISTIGIKKGA